MKGIRLTDFQVIGISKAFRTHFLKDDHSWLFGSRADLNQKGGDIDLYIETSIVDSKEIVKARLEFLAELDQRLGEQKIDVVIKSDNIDLPIYEVAKTQGVQIL